MPICGTDRRMTRFRPDAPIGLWFEWMLARLVFADPIVKAVRNPSLQVQAAGFAAV